MYQQTVVIRNKAGIHCRPSSVIMFTAEPYSATHEILITGPRGASKLTSILDLLTMGLHIFKFYNTHRIYLFTIKITVATERKVIIR